MFGICKEVRTTLDLLVKIKFLTKRRNLREYKGDRALMSLEVAKKSLDFLVANSGFRRNLEVDFFGGEPLMNWDVVKKTVEYGRSLEEKYDKVVELAQL